MLKVDIETSYSKETFIIPQWNKENDTNYYNSKFYCIEDYAEFYIIGEFAFCDTFEIINTTEATQEETDKMNQLLNENGMSFYEAQTRVCYPNHDSVNEIIAKYAES